MCPISMGYTKVNQRESLLLGNLHSDTEEKYKYIYKTKDKRSTREAQSVVEEHMKGTYPTLGPWEAS